MSQVVWVTGVAGFTGSHLVSHLSDMSKDLCIIGLDLQSTTKHQLHAYHQIDLLNADALGELASKSPPDIVFHLAGLLPPRPEADMWQVNVGGTINLIQSIASAERTPRLISIGSAAEYLPTESGHITELDLCPGYTAYGRVKWGQSTLALHMGHEHGVDVIVARPFNLVGPGLPNSLVAAQFCEQFIADDSSDIKVGNIESSRDFVDIRDAVAAYWRLAEKGIPGQIYNISSGMPTRISSLIEIFASLSQGKHKVVVDSQRFKSVDTNVVFGSNEKLRKQTSWTPIIPLQKSLTDMYNEALARCQNTISAL